MSRYRDRSCRSRTIEEQGEMRCMHAAKGWLQAGKQRQISDCSRREGRQQQMQAGWFNRFGVGRMWKLSSDCLLS